MAKPSKRISKLTHIKMFGEKNENNIELEADFADSQNKNEFHTDNEQYGSSSSFGSSSFGSNGEKNLSQPEESSIQLPKFLQNIQQQPYTSHQPKLDVDLVDDGDSFGNYNEFKPKENNLLSFGYLGGADKEVNPNSFSSIFNKDHSEQAGVQRVFRKSVVLLTIQAILFSALVLIGINFFTFNSLLLLIVAVLFVTITNVFYIILADKSYIWLSLATQGVGLLLFNSFIGQGFSPINLLFTAIILFMSYTAYTEVEKFQLGSRLFKISIITGEATRILTNVVAIVVALGVFNSINSYGSQKFIDEVALKNEAITSNVLDGAGGIGLNRLMIKDSQFFNKGDEKYRFYDLLDSNYRSGEELTDANDTKLIAECSTDVTKIICTEKLKQFRMEKATKWAKERYPNITFPVDTVLTVDRYQEVVHEYYSQLVKNFVAVDDSTEAKSIPIPIPSFIPRTYLIPAVIALLVYVLLLIARIFLNWIIFVVTSLLWKILEITHFVNIDVENVEAEVVSI